MPTIIVDKAKGLYQKAATSANPAGSLSGHKVAVKTLTGATTLTNADSGKVILLAGAAGTIQFPVEAGWHAEFLITGSLDGNVVLSGSDAGGLEVTSQGLENGADGSTDAIAIAAGVGATFGTAAVAGDTCKVRVLTANLIQFKADVST